MARHGIVACALVVALGSASSCYRTVVRDGSPTGQAPVLFERAWHHGFVFGIGEIPATGYRLDALCPDGWSELEIVTSGLNSIVSLVLGATIVYSPQTISVRCQAAETTELGEDDHGQR